MCGLMLNVGTGYPWTCDFLCTAAHCLSLFLSYSFTMYDVSLSCFFLTCWCCCGCCCCLGLRPQQSSKLLHSFATSGAFWDSVSAFFVSPEDDALQCLLDHELVPMLLTCSQSGFLRYQFWGQNKKFTKLQLTHNI